MSQHIIQSIRGPLPNTEAKLSAVRLWYGHYFTSGTRFPLSQRESVTLWKEIVDVGLVPATLALGIGLHDFQNLTVRFVPLTTSQSGNRLGI